MANYHKRNSIRAVQWAPENAQSFEDIKKITLSVTTPATTSSFAALA